MEEMALKVEEAKGLAEAMAPSGLVDEPLVASGGPCDAVAALGATTDGNQVEEQKVMSETGGF